MAETVAGDSIVEKTNHRLVIGAASAQVSAQRVPPGDKFESKAIQVSCRLVVVLSCCLAPLSPTGRGAGGEGLTLPAENVSLAE